MVHLVEIYARGKKIYPLDEEKILYIDNWLKYNKDTFRDAITSFVVSHYEQHTGCYLFLLRDI